MSNEVKSLEMTLKCIQGEDYNEIEFSKEFTMNLMRDQIMSTKYFISDSNEVK